MFVGVSTYFRQNVVGGVPCPPVGVTAGKYSFGMSYSVSVGRDALVPPPTRLTRCHFERSGEISCGRNGTTRTRASPFAGALVPPAGSPCGQVVGARTNPLAERGRCVPRPAGREPLRASRRCPYLHSIERGRCVPRPPEGNPRWQVFVLNNVFRFGRAGRPRPAANQIKTMSFRPKR